MKRRQWIFSTAILVCFLSCQLSSGEDWPTYRHDRSRSGVTAERLALPLREAWVHRSRHAPRPAWPAPARQDFWHEYRRLQPAVTYDRAYHVAVAKGAVYYGSSADDKVYCLDAETGDVRWFFFTEGPVRLAPTVYADRVYVGSDDGCVYCLGTKDGAPLWKRRVAPEDRRIPGNGRMISVWPVRTGILVEGDVAYCCAGLFPNEGVYVCALQATDGSLLWTTMTDRASPQGYLLATENQLLVPTGRTAPAVFARKDGAYLGEFPVQGGSFALVTQDIVVSGPGRATGQVEVADAKTRERIASFDGLDMIVHRGAAYLHSQSAIAALDRFRYLKLARKAETLRKRKEELEKQLAKTKASGEMRQAGTIGGALADVNKQLTAISAEMRDCFLWQRTLLFPYSCILAGDMLLTGGENAVAALSAEDGRELWTGAVDGRAYGLAVASGRLFVSTDTGTIHCFVSDTPHGTADSMSSAHPQEI
jgi:outer membrane protein assembly factor BamB